MGRRSFLVTPEMIRELIPLPASTTVIGSFENDEYVEIVVDDPAFAHVSNSQPPHVKPIFKAQEPVRFLRWEDA